MRQLLLLPIILFLFSCGGESKKSPIDVLTEPNMDLYEQFGFKPEGKIIYQFYHEYGFTDKVWHLITILEPDSMQIFENELPIDSLIMNEADRIYLEKFEVGYPIQFSYDYSINADVSIHAEEYHNEEYKLNVNHDSGTYSVKKIGKVYILRVYDSKTNLEYIELKRV